MSWAHMGDGWESWSFEGDKIRTSLAVVTGASRPRHGPFNNRERASSARDFGFLKTIRRYRLVKITIGSPDVQNDQAGRKKTQTRPLTRGTRLHVQGHRRTPRLHNSSPPPFNVVANGQRFHHCSAFREPLKLPLPLPPRGGAPMRAGGAVFRRVGLGPRGPASDAVFALDHLIDRVLVLV